MRQGIRHGVLRVLRWQKGALGGRSSSQQCSMEEAIKGHEQDFKILPDGRCVCSLNQHTMKWPKDVQNFIRCA